MQSILVLSDAEIRALGDGDVVVRDGVVSPRHVRTWAAEVDALDAEARLTAAGMGRDAVKREGMRDDRTTWLDNVAEGRLPGLGGCFESVRSELNHKAWLGLRGFSVQLAVYPGDGARYVAHRDAFADDPVRRATAILYLNPDWKADHGGCLRVWDGAGHRDIEPLGGRMVMFLSDRVEHEVRPTWVVRRAATAWYRGPDGLLPRT